jgi:hypothetical protein
VAKLTSPSSTAVIDVPDELVERYTVAGWAAEKPKPAPKAAAKVAPKRDEK